MTNPTLDAGIPILTEVITTTVSEAAPKPVSKTLPAVQGKDEPQALEARAAQLDEASWDRMEREIRERILRQVLERIDFVLEQRVRDGLADVLQLAVEQLAADIKGGLHSSIKELVTRSVTQEIAKLQITKK
jgi:hypothetical protein